MGTPTQKDQRLVLDMLAKYNLTVLDKHRGRHVKFKVVRPDGAQRWVVVAVNPDSDQRGFKNLESDIRRWATSHDPH